MSRTTFGIVLCAAVAAAVSLGSAPAVAKKAGEIRTIEVGPIWNQMDADRKCPAAARKNGGVWTGQWRTTVPGQMSVCEITTQLKKTVEVGPIWNQMDAERKCPEAARAKNASWTGQWWTTVPGRMSVCEIRQ
jgi:hypothetical protein